MTKPASAQDPRFIKIRYAPGERGWAIDLGNNKAEIANIPAADMNAGDVVTLDKDSRDGMSCVGKVVERRWPKKSKVNYPEPHAENYKQLHALFRQEREWPMEGWVPGLCSIAHPDNADLVAIAGKSGLKIEVEDMPLMEVSP